MLEPTGGTLSASTSAMSVVVAVRLFFTLNLSICRSLGCGGSARCVPGWRRPSSPPAPLSLALSLSLSLFLSLGVRRGARTGKPKTTSRLSWFFCREGKGLWPPYVPSFFFLGLKAQSTTTTTTIASLISNLVPHILNNRSSIFRSQICLGSI